MGKKWERAVSGNVLVNFVKAEMPRNDRRASQAPMVPTSTKASLISSQLRHGHDERTREAVGGAGALPGWTGDLR